MDINKIYSSDYLKADDLGGIESRPVLATINDVSLETMQDNTQKICVHFQGYDKGLLLNVTNARNLSSYMGPETDGWKGKQAVLYVTMVDYAGKSTEGIRVRQPKPQAPKPAPVPKEDDFSDSIPF